MLAKIYFFIYLFIRIKFNYILGNKFEYINEIYQNKMIYYCK